ncbi:hypothetical protein [Marivirga lumbricoides]|uniref:hypothetical protein n=1 Tax=Marivirga lumbricoides TaxID=1046115 RepID=UPI001668A1DD
MDRFPPPDNDRDKLRGNDYANCNLREKPRSVAHRPSLFCWTVSRRPVEKKDLNKQALNAFHHHKSRQLSSLPDFIE